MNVPYFFRNKIIEYKLIESINSNETSHKLEIFNIERQSQINELFAKFETLQNGLSPSFEANNFLLSDWPNSLTDLRSKTKPETSVEFLKLQLASLAFNYSINLPVDDTEKRKKLLDFVDELISIRVSN